MMRSSNTIIVTGAGGYIGSVLVPKLLEKGYAVVAVDRFFFGKDKLASHPALTLLQEDTRCLSPSVFEGAYAVIDLVAISNDPSGELFDSATWQINHESRARSAKLAKAAGVSRYILPSSCSLYGFQKEKVDENSSTNPLTTYAKANQKAEEAVLPLRDDDFVVTVIRQATVFGYSPRMRFDLAINGMVWGAWKNRKLPLMRDGQQYRPMVHVQDTTDVMCLLLEAEASIIQGQIFNVGGDALNYQLGPLGEKIAQVVGQVVGETIPVQWYGDVDHRSYYVSFNKIKTILGWEPKWDGEKGALDIVERLASGRLTQSPESITLNWYKTLEQDSESFESIKMYGGMLNIEERK